MTNEELVGLIQSGVNVETNMAELYQQNRNFIYKIALPYSKTCEMDDLMQESYFGLSKAVKDFKPEQEFMFLTYAEYKIRSQIRKYYYNCGRTKRIPAHLLTLISKYHKFLHNYRLQHDNEPTEDEIMRNLQITQKQLNKIEKCVREMNCQSLDDVISGTDDMTLAGIVADDYDLEEDVTERIATEQCKAALWQAVDELDYKHKTVVERRYKQKMTLSDVAMQEGVTLERIRQFEKKAFDILRIKNKVREAALFHGYYTQRAYRYGVKRFKETGESSTESIALRRLELEEQLANLDKMIVGL